jgi:hypothetical protein
MHRVRAGAPLLLAAGAIALAGCGSSSSKSSGSSAALSAAQLKSRASAACHSYVTAEQKVKVPKDFVNNPVSAAKYLDQIKPLVHKELSDFEALAPPSALAAQYAQLLKAGKHQVALFDAADSAAHAKNPAGLRIVAQIQQYHKLVLNPIEKKLGFSGCVT